MKKKRNLLQKFREGIKKFGTLNIILIIVFAFFILFHFQMLQLYKTFGSLPESYAIAVVGATIGEAGICGWIRTNKDRHRERQWEKEDERERKRDPPTEQVETTDLDEYDEERGING